MTFFHVSNSNQLGGTEGLFPNSEFAEAAGEEWRIYSEKCDEWQNYIDFGTNENRPESTFCSFVIPSNTANG
jgi:hypothetical protein